MTRKTVIRYQFKRCARGTDFLPKIMESPRGSSAIIMEIGRSSIQFKRCSRGTVFLPKIMESPRGSSGIIMEIGRSSIQFTRCARGTVFLPKITESQEGVLPSSWRSAASRFQYSHAHGESKRELRHHHGISQKNPFDIVIYL